jgi:CHAD domain-containing protein
MLLTAPDRAIMSRKSKWIEVESPLEPSAAAASRAIESRLKTVWEWLRAAAASGPDDPESVHQLRVSTRRARAALAQFSDMAPGKRSKWFARQLKRLRKTAGKARDLDVLIARLEKTCPDDNGRDELLNQLSEQRLAAQGPIRKIYRQLKERRFRQRIKALAKRVAWCGHAAEPSFFSAAQARLRIVAASFFSTAETDLESTLAMHEFRLATKQFRYAMELFAGAFAESYRKELYPLVEELQEKLGAVNDHVTARDSYLAMLDNTLEVDQQKLLSRLIAIETAAINQAMASFRQWWNSGRAASLKARFWQEISGNEICCA